LFAFGPIFGILAAILVLGMANIAADENPCIDFSWEIFFWFIGISGTGKAIVIGIKAFLKDKVGEKFGEVIFDMLVAFGAINYPPTPHNYPDSCNPQ